MKISKKTLIIIAIVVAVAAYLLWRRKKDEGTAETGTSQQPAAQSRLEELITLAGLTSAEAELVRNFKPSGSYKEWIEIDAMNRGLDYESGLLLNCMWNRYRNADNTAFQSEAFSDRYHKIYEKVLAAN